ncbi:maleylpyruvate isomerase family mycothiol-dependent enzyme [Actinoplanes sp. LDG1-06]|uniref:Maleylpyruvate isomerase family mycothiol-dependent enzyme n=1 Tax=Paractinoplanes ovalisporus TaxID=2810368 RepID=A0ABS2A5A5_9ACTN|nr:maleylpyruvate isomerase family mycothiol-dependent enzyme [Actinoplanes ovalisporus]MBM2615018.1 maleylpyruvate isomerase family mycothiol-dependent enzyme [Actinoplanes ovalisporus]
MTESPHVGDLAGPYAVGACSPTETVAVAAHVSTCAACAAEIDSLSRTADWIGVTAARPPSPGLRSRVLAAALAARPAAAHPAAAHPAVAHPTAAYRSQVAELDRLLADLPPVLWQQPSRPHPTVRTMIGHLTSNDGSVAAAAGVELAPVEDVRRRWRVQADAILVAVDRGGTGLLDRPVRLAGRREMRRPLREALIQRGFETWIHAEDVRAVMGLPPQRPDAAQAAGIVGFALPLLSAALPRAVSLVLTGDGGGTHLAGPGAPAAEVTLPAERFCRLLAGRLTADTAGAVVAGDPVAAHTFLTVAATMGCD